MCRYLASAFQPDSQSGSIPEKFLSAVAAWSYLADQREHALSRMGLPPDDTVRVLRKASSPCTTLQAGLPGNPSALVVYAVRPERTGVWL